MSFRFMLRYYDCSCFCLFSVMLLLIFLAFFVVLFFIVVAVAVFVVVVVCCCCCSSSSSFSSSISLCFLLWITSIYDTPRIYLLDRYLTLLRSIFYFSW